MIFFAQCGCFKCTFHFQSQRKQISSFVLWIKNEDFLIFELRCKLNTWTRMHSSKMRTFRCSSRLWGSGRGGVGVCSRGGVSARHPQSTEWHTGVKILPCRNNVTDGNYNLETFVFRLGEYKFISIGLETNMHWMPTYRPVSYGTLFSRELLCHHPSRAPQPSTPLPPRVHSARSTWSSEVDCRLTDCSEFSSSSLRGDLRFYK